MSRSSNSALNIANKFILLAGQNGYSLTNMQLQKLVYIAFGFYAGFRHERLFDDEIQAWNYGPVIPNLYHQLKKYGVGEVTTLLPANPKTSQDESAVEKLVEAVWNSYGKKSALFLSSLTHQDGTPWSIIREETKGRQHATIPFDLIREHYETLIRDRANARN